MNRHRYDDRDCEVLQEQIRNDECRWVEIRLWSPAWTKLITKWVRKDTVTVDLADPYE